MLRVLLFFSLILTSGGVPTDGTEYPVTGFAHSASKLCAALAGVTRNSYLYEFLTAPSWFVGRLSKSPSSQLNFDLTVLILGKEVRYLMASSDVPVTINIERAKGGPPVCFVTSNGGLKGRVNANGDVVLPLLYTCVWETIQRLR